MTLTTVYPVPNDRCYDSTHHMWAQLVPETGRVIVGIDALELAALGELAYVSFGEPGTQVRRGESIGTLEAAKMTTDLVTPVSGILVDYNGRTLRDPTLVNRDPYDQGWLVTIDPSRWEEEADELIGGAAISAWAIAEIERYRKKGWLD